MHIENEDSTFRDVAFPGMHPKDSAGDLLERMEKVQAMMTSATEDIRFRIAQAIRGLLGQATRSAISSEDKARGPKSIKTLAEVLRNTAALVDSLHDLAREDILLSNDVEAIVVDISDMLHACRDFAAVGQLDPKYIVRMSQNLDASAQAVEKSEEVLDLVQSLTDIELGVNNVGLSSKEFRRLAGPANPDSMTLSDLGSPQSIRDSEFWRKFAEQSALTTSVPLRTSPDVDPTMMERGSPKKRAMPDNVIGTITTTENGKTYEYEVKRDDAVAADRD